MASLGAGRQGTCGLCGARAVSLLPRAHPTNPATLSHPVHLNPLKFTRLFVGAPSRPAATPDKNTTTAAAAPWPTTTSSGMPPPPPVGVGSLTKNNRNTTLDHVPVHASCLWVLGLYRGAWGREWGSAQQCSPPRGRGRGRGRGGRGGAHPTLRNYKSVSKFQ